MPEPEPADGGTPATPAAADGGAARMKVLIGGVALLFALTLVGLGVVIFSGRQSPPTEPRYVPPAEPVGPPARP